VTLLDKGNKASVKKNKVFRGCASLYTHSTRAGVLIAFFWRLSPGKPHLRSVQMTPLMVCVCVYVSVCIVKCFLFLFLFLLNITHRCIGRVSEGVYNPVNQLID
jgi:hypothetical protein